jgi:hypothetical protein
VTLVKAIGKQCVTPGPKGPVMLVPLLSPKPGLHTPRATLVQPRFLHPAAIPPADPTPAQVQQALLDFLQGGGQGAPMPRSPFPGTLPTPDLPLRSALKSEWLAPAVQKIYDLAAFLPSSGMAKLKITSPKEWISVAHQLGQSISASSFDHDFFWSEYICYIEMMTILFEYYEFSAVLNYDCAWRHWRHAYSKPGLPRTPLLKLPT